MLGRRLIKVKGGGGSVIPTSFNTVIYTGNGSNRSISGVGFQPDLVWLKNRSAANYHILTDSITGANKQLYSNAIEPQQSDAGIITGFNTVGFDIGLSVAVNANSQNYVAWCWKAGGAAITNTNGSIASQVSANVDSGFSVVKYTGNQSNATIGHGLDTAPKVIIAKSTTVSQNWAVYHYDLGTGKWLMLNGTNGSITENIFGGVHPSATTFNLNGNVVVNASGSTNIAYCFSEKAGFSKFGSYSGVVNSSNPIDLGFEPAFILVKRYSSAENWVIFDNKRSNNFLMPDKSDAEITVSSNSPVFTSTGFYFNGISSGWNVSGSSYIYMAFANQF
jgi:hypothetical protein